MRSTTPDTPGSTPHRPVQACLSGTGPGVGTLTLPGLFHAVGGPTINSGRSATGGDEYGLWANIGEEAFQQDGDHTSKEPGSAEPVRRARSLPEP